MSRVLLLALLALALVGFAAGCGGGDETSPTPETVEGTLPEEEEVEGDAEAGAEVWNMGGCGGCHVLAAAEGTGAVGPNLDESKPDAELVVDRVTNGQGAMPSFKDQFSDQQIADVAAFVVESTSG